MVLDRARENGRPEPTFSLALSISIYRACY